MFILVLNHYILIFVCAASARIRLHESPRYLLAILQWKTTVSANLRSSSTNITRRNLRIQRILRVLQQILRRNRSSSTNLTRRTLRIPAREIPWAGDAWVAYIYIYITIYNYVCIYIYIHITCVYV